MQYSSDYMGEFTGNTLAEFIAANQSVFEDGWYEGYTEEGMGADYWVQFSGSYLFHSVPTGEAFGDYLPEEGAKLGQPASHGCVRLTVADAQWFYDQVPDGTLVTIA